MKLREICAIFSVLIGLMCSGCTTVVKNSMVRQVVLTETKEKKDKKISKIADVLIKNGYDIEIANENLGLIKTDWKNLTSGSAIGNALDGVNIVLRGSATKMERYLQIQVKLSENEYILKPRYKLVTIEKRLFHEDRSEKIQNFDYTTDKNKEMIEKIIEEINQSINAVNNYKWEIKDEA